MRIVGQGAQITAGPAQTPGLPEAEQRLAQWYYQQVLQIAKDENVRSVVQKAITAGPENLSETDRQAAINMLGTGCARASR